MIRKIISRLLIFSLAVSALTGITPAKAVTVTQASNYQLEEGTYKDGEVLVTMASPAKTSLAKKGSLKTDSDIEIENSWAFGNAQVLGKTAAQKEYLEDKKLYISKVSSDTYSTEELMAKLEKQAYVVSVEPDYYQEKMSTTTDTYADSQWYLDGTGRFTTTSKGIQYSTSTSTTSPIVAVVDTGVDYTNEDLSSHMWINTYSSLSGTYGYDYGDNDSDPMDTDEDGHGTHCAGVISATTNNQKGITGVSSNARIMALKVFDSQGNASNSAIVGAFNYIYKAQQLGVKISAVNCSWGGGASNSTMKELIQKIGDKGALFVFASGNDGKNQDGVLSTKKECPYDIDSDYIVTVGASNTADTAANFSDYGASSVSLFAPGTQILSTINSDNFFPTIYSEEKRAELCAYYNSCDDASAALYTPAQIGKSSGSVSYQSMSHSSLDFYGDTTSGSISTAVSSYTSRSTSMALYMDVTDLNLSTASTYYIATDVAYEENGDLIWEHYSAKAGSMISYGGKKYLKVVGLSGSFGTLTYLYVDNIAISKANPDTSSFGKYTTMNGTSMAAPVVSGAVGVLASTYTSDTTTQRKERLLSCVRSVAALSTKCITGGILDMSKIATSTVSNSTNTNTSNNTSTKTKVAVKKVKLNKSTATLRYGKKLKLKATVTPTTATNKKVKWYVSKTKYAKVTQSGVVRAKKKGIGHTVKVYAKAKDGSGKKAYCKVKIKKKKK